MKQRRDYVLSLFILHPSAFILTPYSPPYCTHFLEK